MAFEIEKVLETTSKFFFNTTKFIKIHKKIQWEVEKHCPKVPIIAAQQNIEKISSVCRHFLLSGIYAKL